MSRRVLVPVDRSDHSTRALDRAPSVDAEATLAVVDAVGPARSPSVDTD